MVSVAGKVLAPKSETENQAVEAGGDVASVKPIPPAELLTLTTAEAGKFEVPVVKLHGIDVCENCKVPVPPLEPTLMPFPIVTVIDKELPLP